MTPLAPRPHTPAANVHSDTGQPLPQPQHPDARRAMARWTAGVLIAGMVWALFYLWHAQLLSAPALYEEPDIGRHLAQGHGFLSPYDRSATAPPTTWSPPVYPLIVAGAYWTFGLDSPSASVALSVLNAFCFGAVGAGLVVLGGLLFWPAVGYLAAVLFYAHPMFLRATAKFWDAYPALAIFVWLIIAAIALRRGRATALRLAGLGTGLGILALTNASYVLTMPAIVMLAAGGRGRRRPVKLASASLLAFVLVLTPWTIRNYATFGELLFVRGGANLELWFGNLPLATGWLNSNSFGPHPDKDPAERRMLLEWGEPAYFKYCGQRFRENYRREPWSFWQRSLNRLGYLFLSDPTDPAHYPFMPDWTWRGYVVSRVGLNSLVTILGLAGAWTAWRLGYRTHWLIGLALLSVTPFMVAAVWDRHTMPLRVLLLLLGAFVLSAVVHRWRSERWPAPEIKYQPLQMQSNEGPGGVAPAGSHELH